MRNFFKFTFIVLFCSAFKAQVTPVASITIISPLLCTGTPITFSAVTNTSPVSYTWAVVGVKGLAAYSDLHSPTLSLTFTTPITYTVYLNVSNSAGTTVSFTTVAISRSTKASFNASLTGTGFPSQLVLTNYSANAVKNYWKFSDAADVDSAANTVKNYNTPGSYSVTLVAKGNRGCNDTASYAFRISDSSGVKLPNVFSPNNDDVNEVFRPITRGISSLRGWVYNRYGVLIASWDKVNGFWDGYTTSGEPCSVGEYFVVVEAFGFDGRVYKLKGEITLVR